MEFVRDHEPLLLIKAAETVTLALRRHLQQLNDKVTVPQSLVLGFLADNPDSLIGDVSKATRLQASSLTGILERMEKSGWLKRRADKDDKRAVRLKLTPVGAKLEQTLQKGDKAFLNDFNKVLSVADRKALKAACMKLSAAFADEGETKQS